MSLTNEDKEWIEKRFEQVERRFEKVEAKIEQVETTLLTELHKWASPVEMRQRSHTAVMRTLDIELEALAERVTKLEPPPKAA